MADARGSLKFNAQLGRIKVNGKYQDTNEAVIWAEDLQAAEKEAARLAKLNGMEVVWIVRA